jgi:hypothetical protein
MSETTKLPYKIDLTVKDLADVVRIIDMCAERGAFKGPELEAVGSLRGRFFTYINGAKENNTPVPQTPVKVEK